MYRTRNWYQYWYQWSILVQVINYIILYRYRLVLDAGICIGTDSRYRCRILVMIPNASTGLYLTLTSVPVILPDTGTDQCLIQELVLVQSS